MKLRISFAVPPGMLSVIPTIEIEADGYFIDPRLGTLTIANKPGTTERQDIVVYAPGVWRSIADVGAFTAAQPKEAPREDSRRR